MSEAASRRSAGRAVSQRLTVVAGLAFFLVCWRAAPAVAAPVCASYGGSNALFADPVGGICRASGTWIDAGKGIATNLLVGLLAIEFVVLGIRQTLFKSDLSALIGNVAYRVFVSGLMIFLIANADTLFEGVVRGFETGAWNLSGTNGGTADTVAATYGSTALVLLTAVARIHMNDVDAAQVWVTGGNTVIVPPPPPACCLGTGPILSGNAMSVAHAHDIELAILSFMAMLLYGCAATVLISYILFTAESFIVIFGGIVFLGFMGSSFTESFAGGYMRYAINNGARLFMLYLVLGIEQSVLPTVLGGIGAAASVIALSSTLSSIPGLSQLAILTADAQVGVMGVAALQVIVLTSLVFFVPNFVAGVISGQSTSSASDFVRAVGGAATQMQQGFDAISRSIQAGPEGGSGKKG